MANIDIKSSCCALNFLIIFLSTFSVLGLARGSEMNRLTFAGMVGIADPPREGVCDAIRTLVGSGIAVKMLTGDSEQTAMAVGTCWHLRSSACLLLDWRAATEAYRSDFYYRLSGTLL